MRSELNGTCAGYHTTSCSHQHWHDKPLCGSWPSSELFAILLYSTPHSSSFYAQNSDVLPLTFFPSQSLSSHFPSSFWFGIRYFRNHSITSCCIDGFVPSVPNTSRWLFGISKKELSGSGNVFDSCYARYNLNHLKG
jgi:hypothetical protein